MIHFRKKVVKGHTYLQAYQGDKFIKHLGREDKLTPKKLNFLKRKFEGRLKSKSKN